MNHYTPINQFKLTAKGRELIKHIDKWVKWYSIPRIELKAEEFDLLLMSVTPSMRQEYQDVIPYKGKKLVRV